MYFFQATGKKFYSISFMLVFFTLHHIVPSFVPKYGLHTYTYLLVFGSSAFIRNLTNFLQLLLNVYNLVSVFKHYLGTKLATMF